jgi:hypothetical protein
MAKTYWMGIAARTYSKGALNYETHLAFSGSAPFAILTGSVVHSFTSQEYVEPTPLRAFAFLLQQRGGCPFPQKNDVP